MVLLVPPFRGWRRFIKHFGASPGRTVSEVGITKIIPDWSDLRQQQFALDQSVRAVTTPIASEQPSEPTPPATPDKPGSGGGP